jgi:hypothetical protein
VSLEPPTPKQDYHDLGRPGNAGRQAGAAGQSRYRPASNSRLRSRGVRSTRARMMAALFSAGRGAL